MFKSSSGNKIFGLCFKFFSYFQNIDNLSQTWECYKEISLRETYFGRRMFLRREKLTLISRVRTFFWPKTGWKRASSYFFHRLARIPGTPYTLAAGFAFGAAASFTPFIGLHFILGGVLAWIIRANFLSSAIGTAVGNPWTFPFIWVGIYEFGKFC